MEQLLKTCYEELFDKLSQTSNNQVVFTAMCGHRYRTATNKNRNPFRLMMVGRAVNGWDEYRGEEEMTKAAFAEVSLKNLTNAAEALTGGIDRFEWVETTGNSAKNTVRKGIDRDESAIGTYMLTRSPLWSYTKAIWDALYGISQPWSARWFENIVWSNLYKIAPHEGGNPDGKLMKHQQPECIKLLKAEIEWFDPTHILFVTGFDWFEPFKYTFSNVVYRGKNCMSGTNKNNIYVEGTAEYTTRKGTICKIVIACRPECRTKESYVSEVGKFLL